MRTVKWKRPTEIIKNPGFVVDGYSRFDAVQGKLGDCWFIAAISGFSRNQQLFKRVVPAGQSFDAGTYCGAFHFVFWQEGMWTDVFVDDRLPTIDDELQFMKSTDSREFWTALLEKAYAKLYGGYCALKTGFFPEAIQDLTGGVCEDIDVYAGIDIHEHLLRAYERGAFMACSISQPPAPGKVLQAHEQIRADGLFTGHAYTITRIASIQQDKKILKLIRLRNPWGRCEWNGAWSDKDDAWNQLTSDQRKRYHVVCDDGEFWMPTTAFAAIFNCIHVCSLTPDAVTQDILHLNSMDWWHCNTIFGSWKLGRTAEGHCTSDIAGYSRNPHYEVTVTREDAFGRPGHCTMLISLTQRFRRVSTGFKFFAIGFFVFKVDRDSRHIRDTDDLFDTHTPVGSSPFLYRRDVTKRFVVKPGRYCIIPSTHKKGDEADFMLRILTEENIPEPIDVP